MLTLNPGSSCDVCAEEYGPLCHPHSIPCGHVLCANCCNTIVEKTSPRLTPVCPFCREQFASDTVRLIRMDFSSSGWSTPKRFPGPVDSSPSDFASEAWARKAERLLMTEGGCSRSRAEARRLEDKVAKVAAKKCSVEEVSTLHKELQEWLTSDVKQDDQTSSLYLSAALLRAILMNHLAHSEASKMAKSIEANLKVKLDDLEITNGKLEAELRKQRLQYSQKSQECQTLRMELSRLKLVSTTLSAAQQSMNSASDARRQSAVSPTPPSTSPTPPATYNPSAQTPLSRFNSMHSRSVSMSSRPITPSPRSYTPGPSPSVRSYTPSIRSQTPGPIHYRPQTPAPPLPLPHKTRRLSQPAPQKMARSTSEEKAEAHERWIPPTDPDSDSPPSPTTTPKNTRFSSMTSRTLASAASTFSRYRDMRSTSP